MEVDGALTACDWLLTPSIQKIQTTQITTLTISTVPELLSAFDGITRITQVMDAIAEGRLIESLCPIPNYNPNEPKPNNNLNHPNGITRIIQVMDAIAEGRLIESFGAGTAAIVSPVDGFRFDGKVHALIFV
jgi:hypothetical protein